MCIKVGVILVDNIIKGINVVIGMNLINQLGGVIVDKDKVKFGHTRSVQESRVWTDGH